MKLADYDALIDRLERLAEESPTAYRLRVRAIALLGYGVMAATLVAGLLLIGGGVAAMWFSTTGRHGSAGGVKVGLVLVIFGGAMVWTVAKAGLVRIAAPTGERVGRDQAPELHAEIERLCATLGLPPVHRIVIDPHYNAAMAQRPRLGLLGWYENTLVLGLPLLRQMTPDQARSVIAHELGHLGGGHSRTGLWILRLRILWSAVEGRASSGPARWFLRWYAPLFNASTFVLARSFEREADRAAAKVTGGPCAGQALVRSALHGRQAEDFWGDLRRRAGRQAEPPASILGDLDRHLATPSTKAQRWFDEAMRRDNNREDPHPCLRERLAIVGIRPPSPAQVLSSLSPSASAATAWLGPAQSTIALTLDQQWRDANGDGWRSFHRQAQDQRTRLAALTTTITAGTASEDERFEQAVLLHQLDGPAAARPALEGLLAINRDHPRALFMLGHDLLDEGDRRGVALIEAAMARDPDAIGPGCALLRDFADANDQDDLRKRAEAVGEARGELEAKAAAERSRLPKPDRLKPHRLDAAALNPLRTLLATHRDVGAADVAEVEVEHLPEHRFFIVVLRFATSWWSFRGDDADKAALNDVAERLKLPGAFLVINGKGETAKVGKAVGKIADARVYVREG